MKSCANGDLWFHARYLVFGIVNTNYRHCQIRLQDIIMNEIQVNLLAILIKLNKTPIPPFIFLRLYDPLVWMTSIVDTRLQTFCSTANRMSIIDIEWQ